jgi:signal transduction histidine kinase
MPAAVQIRMEEVVQTVESTDLAALVRHRESVEAEALLDDVYHTFEAHKRDYCAVLENGQVIGVCSKGRIGFLMGHRYGFAIYSRQRAREHMIERPLVMRRGIPVREVLETALTRQGTEFYEDLVLIGHEDEYLGMIPVPELVRLQSALVNERFATQEVLHRRVVALSRQAGMAEVATGVLHNVGNVLNSLNVSATIVRDSVRDLRLASLEKLAAVLEEHRDDLGHFVQNDPKGKLVPELLKQLIIRLRSEQKKTLDELGLLEKHLEHVKNIVAMQQSYAKVSGILEPAAAVDLVEDALQMNAEELGCQEVNIERAFENVPRVVVDRHKVLQILVNLLRNAKHALIHSGNDQRRLKVSVKSGSSGRISILVSDNGIGIARENLGKIFSHGFTTKKDGHGFGLHSAALAAREMGGTLHAHSDGPGCGAEFNLELPIEKAAHEQRGSHELAYPRL